MFTVGNSDAVSLKSMDRGSGAQGRGSSLVATTTRSQEVFHSIYALRINLI